MDYRKNKREKNYVGIFETKKCFCEPLYRAYTMNFKSLAQSEQHQLSIQQLK